MAPVTSPDLVWIGARTTANPFLVQEIADALQDTDIPVLVKNPVNPDLGLWIGALERFNRAGIRKLGVIHRGFSTSQQIAYRNDPLWRVAIELRTRYPEMVFFADPSHMAGDRKYLLEPWPLRYSMARLLASGGLHSSSLPLPP